ncbi:hypothetical protein PPL_02187 [Heterostelium album PN500]|uniref:Uncharacterized protein n=1 Tax=Heterostelium pallidum (strain ATCC 26659 / Pp 5 / PN500) TaxID=670386 RepID=D3B1L3_HETP5|nr:hypothetical protein PPL_02187 [Heterostelium album PN500]EFA85187.1 hypothetical protein PPL_02187 [Heterostelium album PN500]|eukprot:XP_020437296.1 hypothetical protein PPL_02187 [Heterostelium album PN500]
MYDCANHAAGNTSGNLSIENILCSLLGGTSKSKGLIHTPAPKLSFSQTTMLEESLT